MRGIKERVGKARTDMPWTEQELDPELVQLVENYPKDNRPVILSLLEKYPDVTPFVFKSRLEASEWLENLRAESPALHEARARRTLTLLRQRGSAAALHELSQTIGAH